MKVRTTFDWMRREGIPVDGAWKYVVCIVAALITAGLLIMWLDPPKMSERREELWRQSFVRAEQARGRGDRYRALEMYVNAARLASSVEDWRGQLTIACGLQKLGRTEGPSLYGFNVIVGAMGSAERQKSAEGMKAVADAFTSLGASYASFALSRIRDDWETDASGGPSVVQRRVGNDGGAQPPAC